MASGDPAERVRALTADLQRSRKYRTLAPQTLARVAQWAVARHPGEKEAAKAARRKLHQACAAFVTDRSLARAAAVLAGLGPDPDSVALRAACREVLRCHASTAEREPCLEDLCTAVGEGLEPPAVVADLAAGLNPFAIPWMNLAPGCAYQASDIDSRLRHLAAELAPHLEVTLTYAERDLLVDAGPIRADVVLLLKTLPTLEQQQRGAGAALLQRIEARRVVVSFPAASLAGRRKGMPDAYEEHLDALIASSRWTRSERIAFPSETLYHLWPR